MTRASGCSDRGRFDSLKGGLLFARTVEHVPIFRQEKLVAKRSVSAYHEQHSDRETRAML